MKSINLFTGALLALVGFCAGVAFNVSPIGAIAQRAPETPPAALKSVAHDSTLTGDGTMTVPLGIASGGVRTGQLATAAVTAPKLSAADPPTLGQVLGSNGANLAWQNPPVGGVRVVDSRGQVVGPLVLSNVLRQVGSFTFLLHISGNGFDTGGSVVFYHAASNCSDPRYFAETGLDLWRR